MAFWTACCSAAVGVAGAVFDPEPPPDEFPPPELAPLPDELPPPPEALPPPPVPPPPVWPPPPDWRRLFRAARRARLMTSRHAVYWSLSAGNWLRAFLYV